MDLDVSVSKLKVSKANHLNQQYRLEDQVLKHFPEAIRKTETLELGSYKGFDMALSCDSFVHEYHLGLQRDMTYTATLGRYELGNITRGNSDVLDAIPKLL